MVLNVEFKLSAGAVPPYRKRWRNGRLALHRVEAIVLGAFLFLGMATALTIASGIIRNTFGSSQEEPFNSEKLKATLRSLEERMNSSLSVLNHTCSHGSKSCSLIEAEKARLIQQNALLRGVLHLSRFSRTSTRLTASISSRRTSLPLRDAALSGARGQVCDR